MYFVHDTTYNDISFVRGRSTSEVDSGRTGELVEAEEGRGETTKGVAELSSVIRLMNQS